MAVDLCDAGLYLLLEILENSGEKKIDEIRHSWLGVNLDAPEDPPPQGKEAPVVCIRRPPPTASHTGTGLLATSPGDSWNSTTMSSSEIRSGTSQSDTVMMPSGPTIQPAATVIAMLTVHSSFPRRSGSGTKEELLHADDSPAPGG
ncbi:hypothetical protein APTSU1_001493400 [Apodemus speciosus]|uniref:Uncharacterized protein n=1 Tax=Apodemus speciosus TaxID=105296 RepID=A0ABQ0FKB3_APOSI